MHILDLLAAHAAAFPSKTAFVYLEDGEHAERRLSFAQLYLQVCELGAYLLPQLAAGQRALLLHQDPVAFIVAFLACHYAGVVAVPTYYTRSSKQLARVRIQMADAGSETILTTKAIAAYLSSMDFSDGITLLTGPDDDAHTLSDMPAPREEGDIAFIQYTSGSTSQPKGVVISIQNLMSNQQSLREAFGCNADSVILSWLPFHHDMGLIGNLLHAVYIGCTCVVMAPQHFMQKPRRWLQAISHYRVTHSGGPDFAYRYCLDRVADEEAAKLDLSTWRVAYCGSEPVRKETADRFCEKFQAAGFRKEFFYPCYGLAEATLLVSGARQRPRSTVAFLDPESPTDSLVLTHSYHANARAIVSAGEVARGMKVQIAGPDNRPVGVELTAGEICIAGPSVSQGYWNQNNQDVFYDWDGTLFLRTGDLGFFWQGELFVHGRIKEVLIFRGKNYYPHDLEQLILDCDEALENNGVVVFSTHAAGEEQVVVMAEVKRSHLQRVDVRHLVGRISQVVSGIVGAEPADVVLVLPHAIPRTTSGKLKRVQAREQYARREFQAIAARPTQPTRPFPASPVGNNKVLEEGSYASIRAYLVGLIQQKTGNYPTGGDKQELNQVGIDSLRSMEMLNAINRDLSIGLDATMLLQHSTLADLVNLIENMIWIKNSTPSGKEISL